MKFTESPPRMSSLFAAEAAPTDFVDIVEGYFGYSMRFAESSPRMSPLFAAKAAPTDYFDIVGAASAANDSRYVAP